MQHGLADPRSLAPLAGPDRLPYPGLSLLATESEEPAKEKGSALANERSQRRARTLGIDLAAQAKRTAACVVEWEGGAAAIAALEPGLGDSQLLDLSAGADKVGIDAPFGWPDDFVRAVAGHHGMKPWPGVDAPDDNEFRFRLSFRETDRHVMDVRRPLSVSTDKIGVTAMRCAGLLQKMGDVDRTGSGKVVEVYPAAALERWGQRSGGYKGNRAAGALPDMVLALSDALPALELGDHRHSLETSDDAFDSLVAALVARAAALGLTDGPGEELRERAQREGWIHLPRPGSLASLVAPGLR